MPARIVTTAYRYKRPPRKKKPVLLEVPVIVTKRTATPAKVAPPPANDDRKSAIVITSKRSKLRGEPSGSGSDQGAPQAALAVLRQRAAADRPGGPGRAAGGVSFVVPAHRV